MSWWVKSSIVLAYELIILQASQVQGFQHEVAQLVSPVGSFRYRSLSLKQRHLGDERDASMHGLRQQLQELSVNHSSEEKRYNELHQSKQEIEVENKELTESLRNMSHENESHCSTIEALRKQLVDSQKKAREAQAQSIEVSRLERKLSKLQDDYDVRIFL